MGFSFIGIGTGRCGTKSLARILNHCKNVNVVHEGHLMPWDDPPKEDIESFIDFLVRLDGLNLKGEVSLNILPLVPILLHRITSLKIIHIWREKEAVVESFIRMHGKISRLHKSTVEATNFHASRVRGQMHALAGSHQIFPTFDIEDIEQAYSHYWDFYMDEAAKIDGVYKIYAPDLLSNSELHRMFDYLEIPIKDRKLIAARMRVVS